MWGGEALMIHHIDPLWGSPLLCGLCALCVESQGVGTIAKTKEVSRSHSGHPARLDPPSKSRSDARQEAKSVTVADHVHDNAHGAAPVTLLALVLALRVRR